MTTGALVLWSSEPSELSELSVPDELALAMVVVAASGSSAAARNGPVIS